MVTSQVLLLTVLTTVVIATAHAKGLPEIRSKRVTSDQRIAEYQALMALARAGGSVGHGLVDPAWSGKRKRAFESYGRQEDGAEPSYEAKANRLRLLQRIMDELINS